MYHRKRK